MALSFPGNPTVGQVYQQWTWDGQKWVCSCVGITPIPPGGNDMPISMIVFNTAGTYTYTPSPGMVSAIVEGMGGGGGGGNASSSASPANSAAGGGGGSGGFFRVLVTKAQAGASQNITVGAGGAAQASGTATSFGTMATANGGGPGGANDQATSFGHGGLGGTAVLSGVSGFTSNGDAGGAGTTTTGQPASEGIVAISGFGGSIVGGAGEQAMAAGINTSPGNTGTMGAGGSGGVSSGVAAVGAGGAGGAGWVMITEYA